VREAWNLCSAGLAFNQGLACSDQDWHTGRVAPEVVERQTKGESSVPSGGPSCVRTSLDAGGGLEPIRGVRLLDVLVVGGPLLGGNLPQLGVRPPRCTW
jgi:hypothetical protein